MPATVAQPAMPRVFRQYPCLGGRAPEFPSRLVAQSIEERVYNSLEVVSRLGFTPRRDTPMQRSMRRYPRIVLVLLLVSAVRQPLRPQANFGRISGALTDSSAAVLPKTEVRVINEGTGV